MENGMLWFDNDPKTDLAAKILQAATYYQNKYGHRPNLCFVHPSTLKEKIIEVGKIAVRPYKPVLPKHLWIGMEGKG